MRQLSYWRWHPIRTGPRHLLVICSECQRGAPNEIGWLRRAGWFQSFTGKAYLCPTCSSPTNQEETR